VSDPLAVSSDALPEPNAVQAEDESLISPELSAAVGQDQGFVRASVEAELVRRMAESIEVKDAALDAALASNDHTYDLPPWTIYCITRPQRMFLPGIEPWDTLMAAEELHLTAPLHLGDRLEVAQRIADVQERVGGRVGHSLFITLEWRYARIPKRSDDDGATPVETDHPEATDNKETGEEVARIRHTLAHFRERHSGE